MKTLAYSVHQCCAFVREHKKNVNIDFCAQALMSERKPGHHNGRKAPHRP